MRTHSAEGPRILEGCIGCEICVDVCPGDVLRMDTETNVAVVEYADECWYCGVCRLDCPVDVIRFDFPAAMTRV
jgi:NAD-dependent dihydropyrimidine dehydrogenase PreA subunit